MAKTVKPRVNTSVRLTLPGNTVRTTPRETGTDRRAVGTATEETTSWTRTGSTRCTSPRTHRSSSTRRRGGGSSGSETGESDTGGVGAAAPDRRRESRTPETRRTVTPGPVYDVGRGKSTTMKETVDVFRRHCGRWSRDPRACIVVSMETLL